MMEREQAILKTEVRTPLDARIEQFHEVLRDNPDDVSALKAYGDANWLRGRLLEAMKSYQKLTSIEPDSLAHSLALARIYLDSGLVNEASAAVVAVLKASPRDIEAHILLRRLQSSNGASVTLPVDDTWQDFLPAEEELRAQRSKLEAELQQLDQEIADQEQGAAGSSPEPVIEFGLQMTRVRRGRLADSLTQVEAWEGRYQQLRQEELARLEEEERRRREEEEALRRREEEEEARRRAEEAEAERVRREEEEAARLRHEEEEAERRRQEEEEAQRRAEEEAERQERERQEAEERALVEQANEKLKQRQDALDQLRPGLEPVIGILMKTKGVTSVLVLARDGMLVHKNLREEINVDKISEFVATGVGVLGAPDAGAHLGNWQFWVLEFARGILVLQRITDDYFLVVAGQAGANFGVLTWTIDKNRAQLEEALREAPPVPTDDTQG